METIGLIAAMSQEVQPLLRLVGSYQRARFGSFPGYRFHLDERDFDLVQSGMGIRRAAAAAGALLEEGKAGLLISFGVAGGVQPDLSVGDVVAAERACFLEQGKPGAFQPLAPLSVVAQRAAAEALASRGAHFFRGTTVTTPGSQAVQLHAMEIAHPVLEMETASIARVAAEKGIPLHALRAISDSVEEPLPFDLGALFDQNANLRLGSAVLTLVRKPHILAEIRRMNANLQKAAENLAAVLMAIFMHREVL